MLLGYTWDLESYTLEQLVLARVSMERIVHYWLDFIPIVKTSVMQRINQENLTWTT